eukprot:4778406-Pleurochrysis_carterae.AAC.1
MATSAAIRQPPKGCGQSRRANTHRSGRLIQRSGDGQISTCCLCCARRRALTQAQQEQQRQTQVERLRKCRWRGVQVIARERAGMIFKTRKSITIISHVSSVQHANEHQEQIAGASVESDTSKSQ